MPIATRWRVAAAGAAGLLACGGASPGAAPQVYRITVAKLAFGPAPTGLHVGDVVEWANADILRHSATATDGSFDIDLPPGGKSRTTLKRAGTVTYVCRFHPGMTARLEVAP